MAGRTDRGPGGPGCAGVGKDLLAGSDLTAMTQAEEDWSGVRSVQERFLGRVPEAARGGWAGVAGR